MAGKAALASHRGENRTHRQIHPGDPPTRTREKIMQAVCDVLEQLVREHTLTHYAIGGATAAGFHGEPLATRDVDVFVFIDPPAGSLLVTLEPLFSRLADLGFKEFEEEGLLIHSFPVQFLSAATSLETEAVESAMIAEWEDHRIRVMRPEHLAAIAMTVGRPKDRARLVYLVELPGFDRVYFADILSRHHLQKRWDEWAASLGLQS
ncbi:MAG: hypothetical protein ABIT37_11925 [Luteolibacter sp.]